MDVEKYNNSINNLNELMKAGILTESEVQEKKSLLEEMMDTKEGRCCAGCRFWLTSKGQKK